MALSNGVHTTTQNNAATVTTAGINTQTSGSGAVIGWTYTDGFTPAATPVFDSLGNTWVQVGTEQDFGPGQSRLYRCASLTGGTGQTFSVACTAGNPQSIWVVEIKTTNGAGITLDQHNENLDTTTPYVSSSITTTIAAEVLIGFQGDESLSGTITHTESTGFAVTDEQTDGDNTWTGALSTRYVAATNTYNTSWTISGGTIAEAAEFIASFSEAAGAASSPMFRGS